jgi:hypothetical protein
MWQSGTRQRTPLRSLTLVRERWREGFGLMLNNVAVGYAATDAAPVADAGGAKVSA